jgi:DNA-binding NarL/FixJ family response regulator
MIKIIVAEDNEVVRNGIARLLNSEPDMEVIAEAENGLEVIELLKEGIQPDVVLADLNMPILDGIGLSDQITATFSAIKVIILTMHWRIEFVERALKAGAKGYLLKDGDFEQLMEGIRTVSAGGNFVSKNI